MSSEETHPVAVVGLPMRTLSLRVVAGPDAGKVVVDEADAVSVGTADGNALVLTDPTVSRFHLELARRGPRVLVRDVGSTNGVTVNGVMVREGTVAPGTVLQLGTTSLEVGEGRNTTVPMLEQEALGSLKGRAPVMRALLARVERAARAESGVLLVGESGTGKEVIARELHERSPRAKRPFVTVDCASLAPGVVASELFGHERGAFTGAERRHAGAFERANGGTLFLDEVGELPAALQATLLGALERRRFRRVGGSDEVAVDVRVVAATHRDLKAEVNAGAFRLDLYYRLAVVRLEVPPLRQRLDDLELLVGHFLVELGADGSPAALFSADDLAALRAHRWPGNVRELKNLVEATLAMGERPALDGAAASPATSPSDPGPELPYRDARARVLDRFEKHYLARLLEVTAGNVSAAARHAKMDRSHLIELLTRHGLK
ncbi:MAG: sigma 54-dependent Fis family transcriptional regulator [Myxococcaceae bacterium]|jgi:DNA-binding NtrC family response regulator|nr:sigma 54-dependent Fis family transcriptional regulator [Myxococcaceae bacterium]MCA3012644.1 sigma 54-dependent Fis family transcriptional regulator [Myxococcaceae bacterium]